MTRAPRKAIPGLDILRFAAAALVMLYHLATVSWALPESVTARLVDGKAAFPELFGATWSGFVGVEIFFVISGFVIAYSAAGATAPAFLRSRLLRLYPAAWICAPLSLACLWWFGLGAGTAGAFVNALVLSPFGPWVDGVYWTLGIEIVFYACVALLLSFKAFDRIGMFCGVLGGVSAAYWLVGGLAWPGFLRAHLWVRWVELSQLAYGIFFAIGILLYQAHTHGHSASRSAFLTVLLAAAAVELSCKTDHNNTIFQARESALVPIGLFVGAVALLAALLRWDAAPALARRLRTVGLMTYPLYLIHNTGGASILRFMLDVGLSRFAALAAAIFACIAASLLIATVLEPAVRRALGSAIDGAARIGAQRRPA